MHGNAAKSIRIDTVTRIPLEYVTNYVSVIQRLTLENGAWHQAARVKGEGGGSTRFFNLAELDDGAGELVVPRAWNPGVFLKGGPHCVEAEPMDREFWWPRVELGERTPSLGPNDHIRYDQEPAWKAISKAPGWPWGQILALGCGKGKTVLGLMLAQKRAVPTIIVCHTVQMMQEWSDTAHELLGFDRKHHGFIGNGMVDWEGRDLVFTTMPGLVCREYPVDFWHRFGLAIFDEGDLLGATEMSRILPAFLGERLLLTATVERSDGNQKLYYLHVGPVVFRDVKPDLAPHCYVLDSPVPEWDPDITDKHGSATKMEKFAWSKRYGCLMPHIPRTISRLQAYGPRQEWAMEIVKDLLAQQRKVLFLGERVAELLWFNREATRLWKGVRSGCALGSSRMKPKQVKKNLQVCDVVWGIQQIAKRGLNEPAFDVVVIQYASFMDVGRLQQTIGRALRFMKGKKQPLVLILNDSNVPVLNGKAKAMAENLRKWGYTVEWYASEEETA